MYKHDVIFIKPSSHEVPVLFRHIFLFKIRYSYLISLLLLSKRPVLLTGDSGVGKTALLQVRWQLLLCCLLYECEYVLCEYVQFVMWLCFMRYTNVRVRCVLYECVYVMKKSQNWCFIFVCLPSARAGQVEQRRGCGDRAWNHFRGRLPREWENVVHFAKYRQSWYSWNQTRWRNSLSTWWNGRKNARGRYFIKMCIFVA